MKYIAMGFIAILKESIKVMGKNGKLMASVTTLSIISYSIFFFIFFPSSNFFLIIDMLVKESMIPVLSSVISKLISDSTHADIILPHAFLPLYFIITFLSIITTVTVSSYSCNAKHLSVKELSSSIVKSWTRPLRTGFHTTILAVGYESLVVYLAIPLLVYSLGSSNHFTRVVAVVVYSVAAGVVYLYVSGVWIMSLVVSVVDEDGGGIGALGKSAEILEGRKLDVFLLNVFFNIVCIVALIGWWVVMELELEGGVKIWGWLLLVSFYCLIRVFTFVGYTVLYFRGKEGWCYGELEVELQGTDVDVEYAKLGVTPLVGV